MLDYSIDHDHQVRTERGANVPNFYKEMDIGKNIKLIEWLKTELLDNVAGLFRAFLKGNEEILADYLSNIVIVTYALAKRLGIDYVQLDKQIIDKIEKNIQASPSGDLHKDLTSFASHIRKR
jgi:hypothetical protein